MLMSRIFTTLNPIFALGYAYFWLSTIGTLDYEPDMFSLKEAATGMFGFFILFAIGIRWHIFDDADLPWYATFSMGVGIVLFVMFSILMAPVHLFFSSWHGMSSAFMMAGGLWLFIAAIFVVLFVASEA